MHYLWLFLAGALLCNGVPHLVSGLCGDPFPTPFAKPRGVGDSSPLTNFLWGFANLAGGVAVALGNFDAVVLSVALAVMAAGALAIGVYLAVHFGNVRRGR